MDETDAESSDMNDAEPTIVGFLCSWCAYEGADGAGRGQLVYPAALRIVRVMCTGRVDPQFILEAFKQGAAGVMVLGCRPGECHYKEGNLQVLRRHALMKNLLAQFGIEKERLLLAWVSADEHEGFVEKVYEMAGRLRALGPLQLRSPVGRPRERD